MFITSLLSQQGMLHQVQKFWTILVYTKSRSKNITVTNSKNIFAQNITKIKKLVVETPICFIFG
jgi:hypothetical protein